MVTLAHYDNRELCIHVIGGERAWKKKQRDANASNPQSHKFLETVRTFQLRQL